MEKINIAELLKDCPSGMELDCAMYEDVYFDCIDQEYGFIKCYIQDNGCKTSISFTEYGYYTGIEKSKCVIFPKGKTTWEGFQRPFKDGDIIFTHANCMRVGLGNTWISIYKENRNGGVATYVDYNDIDGDYYSDIDGDKAFLCMESDILRQRLATEEEKEKLFKAIKDNGYKWNAETKTLEDLSKFNAGDVLVSTLGNIVLVSHIDDKQVVHYHCLLRPSGSFMIKSDTGVGKSFQCTLATSNEKQKLFDKLKSAGYKYNSQTNKLEKLVEPNFKVGDRIRLKENHNYIYTITGIREGENKYECGVSFVLRFSKQNDWELVPNKFDISTLKPFDNVLIRQNKYDTWHIGFFEKYDNSLDRYPFICMYNNKYAHCIPYKSNEHLLDTTNDCAEYYKTWE